ncbi:ERF family protein [Paenibacillus apiarius]|uniref:ERF family protein n=1 Tax=Paenibacillus apiarius TaxID=46240 RepID=A0ABT4DVL5_9BACL|nr:ERF family protein [Paenibacillus apiarius]MCY9513275.1 ERF family protein [Paenibacillus apiarius]MCY9521366.1 ERF family protein [Paenibacillus apiarius]MCY9554488.1 ERF family protein [Paenibacillus apiarius]MCY9560691.1 ERF family protein [Paenibacillus apiarius]MCY9685058.1 ERF family protein [Paenibacillus apiarius]
MSKAQLYQKMSAVMQKVDYLQKDDRVEFGTTKYNAISEEKVTSAVREALIEQKLVIFPFEQEHRRDGNLTSVDVKYKIVDTETGEYEVIVSSGTGSDTQDKGVGKAMTYAYKYLLLRTFAIPTGEDPDKTSSAELDAQQKQKRQSSKERQGTQQASQPQLNGVKKTIEAKYKLLHDNSLDGLTDFIKEHGANTETVLTQMLKERQGA